MADNLGGKIVDVNDAELAEMLSHVRGYDDYEVWVKIGMAIHHATGGAAFDLWDRWSQQSSKYDSEEMPKKWQSFGRSANPVTLGTLMHYAEEGGYVQPVTFTPNTEFAEKIGWPEPEMRFLGSRAWAKFGLFGNRIRTSHNHRQPVFVGHGRGDVTLGDICFSFEKHGAFVPLHCGIWRPRFGRHQHLELGAQRRNRTG